MIKLSIYLDGDNCWPDLKGRVEEAELEGVALLREGTAGGKHTVSFRIKIPDGTSFIAQTTLDLLANAVTAMMTRAALDRRRG